MATPGEEIELIGSGTVQAGTVPVSWVQNMWSSKGVLQVRPGWGQLAELDTTLGLNTQGSVYGYTDHLGSCLVKTSFGHTQILSLFLGQASSGSYAGESVRARWDTYFFVRIYDIDTGNHWEEVLDKQTSSKAQTRPQTTDGISGLGTTYAGSWHGTYQTTYDRDHANFVSNENPSEFFFHVYQEQVYFGSPGSGMYVYSPCDFQRLKRQQLQTAELADWHNGLSESAVIKRLSFTQGPLKDTFVYAYDSDLSGPTAATTFKSRLTFATGNTVWFSDVNRPQCVIGVNQITIPSMNKITALAEVRGNLVIFTRDEMFFYQPNEGVVISGGRAPILIGEGVGCVGPQAITMAQDALVWVSTTGIYDTRDGASFNEISSDIRTFWGDFGVMTNPVTGYFETTAGHADVSTLDQPRTTLQFDDRKHVTLAYSELKKALIFSVPSMNACWCFTGKWSFWPVETRAYDGTKVNRISNIKSPWVLSDGSDFYLVSGVDRDTVNDASVTYIDLNPAFVVGTPTAEAFVCKAGSYVLYKLGHGGGLDRSCVDEDKRLLAGKYVTPTKGGFDGPGHGVFYFRPPVLDYSSAGEEVQWVPVELFVPKEAAPGVALGPIQKFNLFFRFDNTKWDAEPDPVTSAITRRFPVERIGLDGGIAAAVTDAVGLANPAGSYINISFDGTLGGYVGAYKPNINLAQRRSNPLLYFSMKAKQTALSVSGFGIEPDAANTWVEDAVPNVVGLQSIIWVQTFIGTDDSNNNNKKVQAVDWAYRGEQKTPGPNQIRARGLYAYLQSHGKALAPIASSWVWGLYNVVLGSDNKDYSSQIIDYDEDISKIQDKLTIRTRARKNTTMTTRTFGSVEWGSVATPADGNYLIDDTETDVIATSDSVKGSTVSYMVFGFVRDKAEKLSLISLRGLFRPAGGRRRRGR